jgi:hypothetical protein
MPVITDLLADDGVFRPAAHLQMTSHALDRERRIRAADPRAPVGAPGCLRNVPSARWIRQWKISFEKVEMTVAPRIPEQVVR